MVKYYFDDKERQEKLKAILDEWVGTPFRHKCGVKGLGCDCIHYVIRVLEEFELVDINKIIIPDYPRDWHYHNTREILKEAIEKYLNVEKISINGTLQAGDIILSHFGKASSHAGIYFKGVVYQSINKVGVKRISFNEPKFRKQMKFAYRIKE